MRKWNNINNKRVLWPSEIVFKCLGDLTDVTVGFLGLSYKKNTNSIKNAPSILNAIKLGCNIIAHDSLVPSIVLPKNIEKVDTPEAVIKGSDALIIFNDADDYTSLDRKMFDKMPGSIVIDPFSVLMAVFTNDDTISYHRL